MYEPPPPPLPRSERSKTESPSHAPERESHTSCMYYTIMQTSRHLPETQNKMVCGLDHSGSQPFNNYTCTCTCIIRVQCVHAVLSSSSPTETGQFSGVVILHLDKGNIQKYPHNYYFPHFILG